MYSLSFAGLCRIQQFEEHRKLHLVYLKEFKILAIYCK